MSSTVRQFLRTLSERVPLSKAAAWDAVGLQLGAADGPAERVAVAHEVTESVLAAVEHEQPDLVISYHSLLFKATNRLVAGSSPEGRAYRLARLGVSVAAVHTAFDVVRGGAADRLASALDLVEPRGFGPLWPADTVKVCVFAPESDSEALLGAMSDAGAGDVGGYKSCSFRTTGTGTFYAPSSSAPAAGRRGELNREPEVRLEVVAPKHRADAVVAAAASAHPYEEPAIDVYDVAANAGFVGRLGALESTHSLGAFAVAVSEQLGAKVRVAGDAGAEVARVAVVPGSGASLIPNLGDVDVLVTGDVSHHQARGALDRGLAIVDAGHAPTERPGVQALYALVAEIADDAIDLTAIDPDPWRE
ncbi:MAG: Nif3-like dinuclear metal center hexameric protein [Acidimicrobiia bacterium]